MDWEIFLGLVGLYVISVASLYHQFTVTRRIINLTSAIMNLLTERRNIIMKQSQERIEEEDQTSEEK